MSVATSMLLDGLDEAFDQKSWHGPNLRGAIRGVTAAQAAWKGDIGILEAEHRKLCGTVADLPASAFTPATRHLIRGAAAHDLYHAGQIRLLRRMCT